MQVIGIIKTRDNIGKDIAGRLLTGCLIYKDLEPLGYPKEAFINEMIAYIYPQTVCTPRSKQGIILDSFGQTILDHIKILVPQLYKYDLNDHSVRKNTYINPFTLDICTDPKCMITAPELYNRMRAGFAAHVCDDYMTLNEFVFYFANYVMRNYFGDHFWTNIIKEDIIDPDHRLTIFYDTRTPCEAEFIRSMGGMVVGLAGTDQCISSIDKPIVPDKTLIYKGDPGAVAESYYNIISKIYEK